jgi:DMSO/TMAO reductase YedYZ molybdopterin-dependent catalytic subunit
MNLRKAERIKRSKAPPNKLPAALASRLPPGQVLTERFPILHEGDIPQYDLDHWSLRLYGALGREYVLRYDDLLALPQSELQCDIHCVTRWSKFDTQWSGVRLQDLFDALGLQPQAGFVMAHADHDYQTNLPLAQLLAADSLLALRYAGQPLAPQHGWPLRLVVAGRYFWKSAKWLRALEFRDDDQPGFWESHGFHNDAEPFQEQRFSGQALDIPEDEWQRKDFD